MSSRIAILRLKIPSESGSPINEYRVHRGQVQFRSMDSRGRPFSYNGGSWIALAANDLELHFALNTRVAQWLVGKLPRPRLTATPLDST